MINNGYTSPYFYPTRGLFQGNPLGPYGFITLIELLAIQLRKSKIKGIEIKDYRYLLSMFADDLSLFMMYDQESWQTATDIFSVVSRNSGLKINYDKTVIYRLGSLRHSNAKFYSQHKMTWTNKPVKMLGTDIEMDVRGYRATMAEENLIGC